MSKAKRVVREGSLSLGSRSSPAAKRQTTDLQDRLVFAKSPTPAASSSLAPAPRSPFEGLTQPPSHNFDSAATVATLRQRNSWLEGELRRTTGDAAALRDRVMEVEEKAREAARVNHTMDHAMIKATTEIEAVVVCMADAIQSGLLSPPDPATASPESFQRPSQAVKELVQALAAAKADLAPSLAREDALKKELWEREHEVAARIETGKHREEESTRRDEALDRAETELAKTQQELKAVSLTSQQRASQSEELVEELEAKVDKLEAQVAAASRGRELEEAKGVGIRETVIETAQHEVRAMRQDMDATVTRERKRMREECQREVGNMQRGMETVRALLEQRIKLAAWASISKALKRAFDNRCRGALLDWRRNLRRFQLERDTVWRTQGPWNAAGIMARRVKAVRILRRFVRRRLREEMRQAVQEVRLHQMSDAVAAMRRQTVLSTQSSMSMAIQAVHRIEGARLVLRLLRRLRVVYPMGNALAAMRVGAALANDWYSNRLSSRLDDRIGEVEAEARLRAEESAETAVRAASSRHRSEATRLRQERDALKHQLLALKMSAGRVGEFSAMRTAASLLSSQGPPNAPPSQRERDREVADVVASARISVLEEDLRVLREGSSGERELLLERIESLAGLVASSSRPGSRPSSRHASPGQQTGSYRSSLVASGLLPEVPAFSPEYRAGAKVSIKPEGGLLPQISLGAPVVAEVDPSDDPLAEDIDAFIASGLRDRERTQVDMRKLRATLASSVSRSSRGQTRRSTSGRLSVPQVAFAALDQNRDGVVDREGWDKAVAGGVVRLSHGVQPTMLTTPASPTKVVNQALDAFKQLQRDLGGAG